MTQPNAPQRKILVTQLDANGAGIDQIQNLNAAVVMKLVQLSVISNPTSSTAQCTVTYPAGGIMDTAYFAGTGDQAGGEPEYLYNGDFVQLTWSNGPANGQGIATYVFYELPA